MCINTLKPSTLNSLKKLQSTNNLTFCASGEILGYPNELVLVTWPVPSSFSFLFKRRKPQTTEPSNALGVSIKKQKFHLLLQFPLLPGNKSLPAGTAVFFVTDEKAESFTGNEVMSDGMGVLGNFPGWIPSLVRSEFPVTLSDILSLGCSLWVSGGKELAAKE